MLLHAGYAAVTGTVAMTAVAACAAIVLLSRKRITWDAWLDMPVGLSERDAPALDMGRTRELILGEPGLRHHPDPWTTDVQQGWLVVLGITNSRPATVRSGDFSAPLTFAFPGREVHATQILPEPTAASRAGHPGCPQSGYPRKAVPVCSSPTTSCSGRETATRSC